MYVYNGDTWQLAGSSVNGTSARFEFTATAAQTTFVTTGYDTGYVDVYLNGVKLIKTVDFDDTSGLNIVLTIGATVGDEVSIIAYGTFTLADHYNKTDSDALLALKADQLTTYTKVETDATLALKANIANFTSTGIDDNATSTSVTLDSSGALLQGTTTAGSAGAGDIVVAGGVYLGGTGAANKLDDYEEGTWTPTITSDGTLPTVTYSSQIGSYTKVGRLVNIQFRINVTSISGGTNNALIGGLPFVSSTTTGSLYTNFNITPTNLEMDAYGVKTLNAEIAPNTAYLYIMGTRNNTIRLAYTPTSLSNTVGFSGGLTYLTDE